MADAKLSALPTITTISVDDILYVVDDPGGSPVSSKVTFDNLQKSITAVASLDSAGAVRVPTGNSLYLGPEDADGSWRVSVSGSTLSFQQRVTGSWVEKGAIS